MALGLTAFIVETEWSLTSCRVDDKHRTPDQKILNALGLAPWVRFGGTASTQSVFRHSRLHGNPRRRPICEHPEGSNPRDCDAKYFDSNV
jgi:hypothetical protein